MYPQHGDIRYGSEFGPGNSHAGLESHGPPGRYLYGPYYGPKGPDGTPYLNPQLGGMQSFGSKQPPLPLQDPVPASRWSAPGYVRGTGLKPGPEYGYPTQPSASSNFTDVGPMVNIPGYPPGYGPGLPYNPQYPYPGRGFTGAVSATYDSFPDSGGGSHLLQPSASWPNKSSSGSKVQEPSAGRASQVGFSTSNSNSNSQLAQATPVSGKPQREPVNHLGEQTGTHPSIMSQQTALSPHGPLDTELKKQASVSSLRDALLSTSNSTTQQQYSAYSPRIPGGHPSPMTPSANFPHTPDASTPTGGSTIMSPPMQQTYDERNESQLHPDSELINSFTSQEEDGQSLRVSPFQVESILGIQNDKPVSYDSNIANVNSADGLDKSNMVTSDEVLPSTKPGQKQKLRHQSDSNSKPNDTPLPSVSLSRENSLLVSQQYEDDKQETPPSPSFSPIDRNHPCITDQYQLSEEEGRREFLDSLFTFATMKGIGLVRIPSLSKAPLDLYKVYGSVQTLGGFIHVMQNNLWSDVVRLSSPTSSTRAGSVRNLIRFYSKLLLPYECHVKDQSVADCLSKVDTSLFKHAVFSKDTVQNSHESELRDKALTKSQMNGETHSENTDESSRLHSQTSESSTGDNSQDCINEGMDRDDSQATEDTQSTPTEPYPQEVSSDDPLPEISAQETESLLAMPSSPYNNASTKTSGMPTPSDPGTPPSSFPPPYPPQGSQEWGSNAEVFSGYPSSYSVEMSPYRPPPPTPPVPPGYNPFAPPSQHDVPMDYPVDVPSPMIRSPYDSTPYHLGVSPAMHGLPPSRQNPYLYRPHMIPRDHFGVRANDIYPAVNSEWAWQQNTPFSGMMQPHSVPFPPRSTQSLPLSSATRTVQLSSGQHQGRSTNPSPGTEATKQHWQEAKAKQSLTQSRTKPEYKHQSTKPEATQILDSLKRPLPDWSCCVEGTKPHLAKRKHLLSVDCGNIEPWRVMMSLKSGLLSESTWALDTLNILLHDDLTVGYFHLKHHHSLLNTLVEHLSKVLQAVFRGEFNSLPSHPEFISQDMVTKIDIFSHNLEEELLNDSRPIRIHADQSDGNITAEDKLSHIQLPTADEKLLFPKCEDTCSTRNVNTAQRLQRIDETPVSEIKNRESVRTLLPLHYFGRSPRRREHSILEDIQIREELEKEIDERLHSDVDGEEKQRNSSDHRLKEVFPSSVSAKETEASVFKEESEIHQKESLPLWSLPPNNEILQGRCLCLSNILRSLSFVPGNDVEFSQHPGVLTMLGRILMLHHTHLIKHKKRSVLHTNCKTELELGVISPTNNITPARDMWWWKCLDVLRENSLVILSNISGQLDLSVFPESVSCPIITGLLHWVSCPSAAAVDPLPDAAMAFALSPQRLVLEALAKISISEINVDFILATPPVTRLDMLFMHLVHFIGQKKHPVMRQFSLVLLSNLAQGNEAASRLLAQHKMIVPLLVECIESSEQTSCNSRGQFVGGYNPEDPNSLSVAMLRRAATTLHCLAKVPLNRTVFLPYRDRTLYLATSQYVEPSVSSILMDMIFELGKL